MAITKKQQIRGVRILLTVFYGFLLSSILFSYIIHGIVETIRRPTNPYAIIMIILGTIILVSIGLSIYATWYGIKFSLKTCF
jgi:biotin transporter BioY